MEIHGREIRFLFSTGAANEVADLCPNGDLRKVPEMVGKDSKMSDQNGFAAKLIAICSKWADLERKYTEPGFVPNPLTYEEVLTLDLGVFSELLSEALDKLGMDVERTVNTAPIPGKKEEEAEHQSS